MMSKEAVEDIFEGYAASSVELISRFEAISSDQLYSPVSDLLPETPSRIADIGAGTGRDAAWFARKGHSVTAVEPVDELRRAGMALHKDRGIVWIDDRLPELNTFRGDVQFDRIFLTGVWQHLDNSQRRIAVGRLASLTAPGGLVIMSLRHGNGAPSRRVHDAKPEDAIEAAASVDLKLVRQCQAPSLQIANQAAGVFWTWLAFRLAKS